MTSRSVRYTKIVATLGPASQSKDVIEQLATAGVDVFRLNFSHGTHEDHGRAIKEIRHIEKERGLSFAIMADLQGPKYRVGAFSKPVQLVSGHDFILDLSEEPGTAERVFFPHKDVYTQAKSGDILLLNDGQVRLVIETVVPTELKTRIEVGGELSSHKGVNLPDTALEAPILTSKDREDLAFSLAQDVDYIALSFVQTAADVRMARELIQDRALILAKIEKSRAVQYIDDIIAESDGILVARGDLGVEMLPEEVPSAQRKLVRKAREKGKPVIIATQMMESMIQNPIPTRAEASDVANAVVEGADGVMLSAETAAGAYPAEAVQFVDRILRTAEADVYSNKTIPSVQPQLLTSLGVNDATIQAATWMVEAIGSSVIVTATTSGITTLRAAKQRHPAEIFALTPRAKVARQLNLVWGVTATHKMDPQNYTEMAEQTCDYLLKQGWVQKGDPVVITAGVPFKTPGSTNMVRVAYAGMTESYQSL